MFSVKNIKANLPHLHTFTQWEVQLSGFPSPFLISEFREGVGDFKVESKDIGPFLVPFPEGRTTFTTLELTFYETHDLKVEKFINDWLSECFNGFRVKFFEDIEKDLFVTKYSVVDTNNWKPVYKAHYKVVPDVDYYYEGKSEKVFQQGTLQLVATKIIKKEYLG